MVEHAATLVSDEVSFPMLILLTAASSYVFPPIEKPLLVQNKTWKMQGKLFSYSSARPRELVSASFPYSLGRMCKSIPTVRIQSRPLTYIFQFLKSHNNTINKLPLLRPCRYIFPSLILEESLSSLPLSLWAQQWCLNLFHSLYSNYNHQNL